MLRGLGLAPGVCITCIVSPTPHIPKRMAAISCRRALSAAHPLATHLIYCSVRNLPGCHQSRVANCFASPAMAGRVFSRCLQARETVPRLPWHLPTGYQCSSFYSTDRQVAGPSCRAANRTRCSLLQQRLGELAPAQAGVVYLFAGSRSAFRLCARFARACAPLGR